MVLDQISESAINSMTYFALRAILMTARQDTEEFIDQVKDELLDFVGNIENGDGHFPIATDYIQSLIREELREGSYLEQVTAEEFAAAARILFDDADEIEGIPWQFVKWIDQALTEILREESHE